MASRPTASQTVGPFFSLGLTYLNRNNIVPDGTPGEKIKIRGKILDGDRQPIPDAIIETWQADAAGKFADESNLQTTNQDPQRFSGFARISTDENGTFELTTIKPGRLPSPGKGLQAPHISVTIFMRGLLKQLNTRIYFPDEPGNDDDLLLKSIEPPRRASLILRPTSGNSGVYQWDVLLQGPDETVFLDV
jgi:protocatechuate 3,4-dioxygenase alpha subunit